MKNFLNSFCLFMYLERIYKHKLSETSDDANIAFDLKSKSYMYLTIHLK